VFRRLFLGLDEPTRNRFGNPFEAAAGDSFFQWAVRPQAGLGGLNPFLDTLYHLRSDLRSAFPDHRGPDRTAFLQWARAQGAHEMGFPPEIVPPSGAAGDGLPSPGAPAVAPRAPRQLARSATASPRSIVADAAR
jgi:hypothetical protein